MPVDELPESPWRDEQTLIGGLAIVNEALATYLQNLIDVKLGEAEPMALELRVSLGSAMVETGNALQAHALMQLAGQVGGSIPTALDT